jgi:hypothetical protein
MRKAIGVGVVLLMSTLAGGARADTPSEDLSNGKVIFGVERVAPIVTFQSVSATASGSSTSVTDSKVSLGLVTGSPIGGLDTFYMVPRFALDFLPTAHLTLGGSVWIYTDVSSSLNSGGQSQDQPKTTYWGVAPRVGYLLPLGEMFAFWPRAGIEYHSLNSSSVTSSVGNATTVQAGETLNQLAADVEANLVITPWNHVGFDLDVYGAIPITGGESSSSGSSTGSTTSISELAIGLTVGLLGYF